METLLVSEERDMALAAADAAVSLLAIDQYSRQVKWTSPLTPEEETALFERLEWSRQAPGDAWRASLAHHACERLTEAYQPLVMRMARRFVHLAHSMELMDCVQQGNIGLLAALHCYRLTLPLPFDGFAIPYITHEIIRGLREIDALVRFPRRLLHDMLKVRRVSRELANASGDVPTCEQLAGAVGMTPQKVEEVLSAAECHVVLSLQAMMQDETVEERFAFTSLYLSACPHESHEAHTTVLREAFAVLSARQRQIVEIRYGCGEEDTRPLTQKQAGQRLGVTDIAIRRTEKRAMERLREQLAMLYTSARDDGEGVA